MARRGENIRKRKDGRWEGRYIKGRKPDRKAIWGYVYGHTYTEVKKELTIRKNTLQTYALSANSLTFSELSQTWESSISLGVKVSTAAHYHYTLQHYILPVLGSCRLQDLSEAVLEQGMLQIIAPQDQSHKALGHTMSRECLTLVRRICRYAAHLHLMRPMEIQVTMKSTAPHNTATSDLENAEMYLSNLGKVLRRFSIDELPQLFNVLCGQMALIGPRPLIVSEYPAQYLREFYGVYEVRPGITGLAQVNGRDTLNDVDKVRYDRAYRGNGALLACSV